MIVFVAAALAHTPLEPLPLPSVEDYEVCHEEVLDLMAVEMRFVERVFVEARECPPDDVCCAVGGFAWWEPAEGPRMNLLRAPGCASDECGRCGFTLVAVGRREQVCVDDRPQLVFRPDYTVTTPTGPLPEAVPARVAWVLFPGMPRYEWEEPEPEPSLPVQRVEEIAVPDARDAKEAVAGP